MIRGIPFSKSVSLFNRVKNIDSIENLSLSLYDFVNLALNFSKNYVVIIDNKFITWLEDICMDYVNKECFLPYYVFDEYDSVIPFNPDLKSAQHLLVDDFDEVIVRYNYGLKLKELGVGSVLVLYSIKDDRFYSVKISSYIDICDFSLVTLYNLYKSACYYDMKTEFSSHESGYTYITAQFTGFINQEKKYRLKLGLPDYLDKLEIIDYADVRYYPYLTYIEKFKNVNLDDISLFKYRNLRFENYLFCHLRNDSVPVDCDDWFKLGKSKRYIKFKDDIPFFIKYYWLNNYEIKEIETWRY